MCESLKSVTVTDGDGRNGVHNGVKPILNLQILPKKPKGNLRRGLPGVSGRTSARSRHEHNLRWDEGRGGEEGQEKVAEKSAQSRDSCDVIKTVL